MKITQVDTIPVSVPRIAEVNVVGRTAYAIRNAEFVIVISIAGLRG